MSALASAATWALGLWRLARGRVRADWRFLVGVWLLLACSTSLLASGIVYGDAVAVGSLRSAIRSAPLAEQGVLVESSLTPAQLGSVDPPVRGAMQDALGAPGGTVGLELRSGSLVPIGTAATDRALTVLESVADVDHHATLTSGRWPGARRTPTEAVLSDAAATALGLHVGDLVPLADASTPGADAAHAVARVTIVGTYRPDPTDAAWGGDALDLAGTGTINGATYRGPFLVDQADLQALTPSRIDVRWRAVPDLATLTADDIEPMRARFDALPALIHGSFPAGGTASVSLEFSNRLDALSTSLGVARGAVIVLTLQFAVVAAYAVLLVSGMLADRRRPEIGLLRSRGASTGHVATLAFGEAILLAVPAVAVAPFVAAGLVRVLGRIGPLASTGAVADATPSATALAVIVITGLVAAVALALPALASGAELAGIRAVLGRPLARTMGQRLGIDIALLAVAGIAIWQLRAYGQPLTRDIHGALGLDPLLAAAPAFGLVAGAVIATRLVPRIGEAGERLLAGTRGLLSPLAARQIARRPLRYTRAALLLILASALGTFAAVYAATWTSSHAEQAAYQTGADLRVTPNAGSTDAWSFGATYRAIPGVQAALSIGRGTLAVGSVVRDGTVIIANDATAADVVSLPPGSTSLPADLRALAAARPSVDVLPIPAGTRWLRIDFDAALTQEPVVFPDGTIEVPPDYRGITVTAIVEDADGLVTTFSLPSTADAGLFMGKGQTFDIRVTDPSDPGRRPSDPRALIGLEFSLANALQFFANPIEGTMTVTGLEASSEQGSATASPTTWAPFGLDRFTGWQWQEADQSGRLFDRSQGLSTTLASGGEFASQGDVELRIVPKPPTDLTVPAIAGEQLLALTGSDVGQTLDTSVGGTAVTLRITGRALEFPTIQPSTPFALVDAPTVGLLSYLAGSGGLSTTSEWWIKTSPGESGAVGAAISSADLRTRSIVDRAQVLTSLESDPVGLGTLGALLLGSLAATAFAVIGFLVGASVATRERLVEFALLRALGLAPGQLWRWIAAENAFLLALGVLAGTAIGLLLGWLLVPATLLGSTGQPVVPEPILEIPWTLIGLVYIGALVLLAVTILLVGRPLPGRSVAAILRAAEE